MTAGRYVEKALHNYKTELYQLDNSPLGKCPPFLIVNATNLMFEHKTTFLARDFSWGVCNVENEDYTDLTLLYKLLLFHFEDTVIDLANNLSEDCVYKTQKKAEKSKIFQKFGIVGGSAAIGLLVLSIYKRLK